MEQPHQYTLPSMMDYLNTLNMIRTPTGHLGILRAEMPQIAANQLQAFLKFLQKHGVSNRKLWYPVSKLKLTQSEFNKFKVMDLVNKNISRKQHVMPILISKDDFVLDGSHRFLALYNQKPNSEIEVYQLNMPIQQLVKLSKEFSGVKYRDHSDRKVDV